MTCCGQELQCAVANISKCDSLPHASVMDGWADRQMDRPKPICLLNFFENGGIKRHQLDNVMKRQWTLAGFNIHNASPVKRICVFEHSVMTNFNCACPAIQRGQGSDFLSEGSSWITACMSEQRRFWRDCADAQARLNLRCSHRR